MTFYNHQKEIIEENKPKTGVFLGTGGGKTRICLHLAEGKTLVIVPKTQFEDQNWQKEVKKSNLDIDLTVISKEMFRRDWEKLPPFDTLISDESHTISGVTPNTIWKNRQRIPKASQLFWSVYNYIQKHNPKRIYLATATPTRTPMAVWAAAKLLGYDWDFYKFRHTFYFPLPIPGREIYSPKADSKSKDKLAELVRKIGYVGRLEDWFDVPDQIYKTHYVEMTEEQKKLSKKVTLDYPDPLICFQKVDQVENGILIGDEYTESIKLKSPKVEAILDYANEFGRLLVFARYTLQIEQIKESLEKEGKKVLVLDGKTKDKGEVIEEANNSEECVVIAQAQISAGYELPDYPCVIFASMSGSQVDLVQGIGRVQRANNIKKNIYVYLVTRGRADMARFETLMDKKDFHERLYLEQEGLL